MGSEWETGPSFLTEDMTEWPVLEPTAKEVPEEELLPRTGLINFITVENSPNIWKNLKSIFYYSNSFTKIIGILARLLRVSKVC